MAVSAMATLIICPVCETRYEVKAAFPPEGRKVRCSKCGHVWQAQPVVPEPAAADVGSLLTRVTPRLTEAEAPLRLPRPAPADVVQPSLARAARRQRADVPLTDLQQNLLHLVAHVSLAKATGTAPTAARRSAVPTRAIAARQLLHADSLRRRPRTTTRRRKKRR